MRMHRTVIAVLAFCLLGLVPFTATSAASAEPVAKAADTTVQVERLAKPRREVVFKFKGKSRTYNFVGKVQNGKRTKVILMRSNNKKGKYTAFKKGRTNAKGNYSWKRLRKPGYFYVKVPGNKKWATSKSSVIRVYYI